MKLIPLLLRTATIAACASILVAPAHAAGTSRSAKPGVTLRLSASAADFSLHPLDAAAAIDCSASRAGTPAGHAESFLVESKSVVSCALPFRESFHAVLLRPDDRRFDTGGSSAAGQRQPLSYAAWRLLDIPSPETLAMIIVAIGLVGIRLFRKSRF